MVKEKLYNTCEGALNIAEDIFNKIYQGNDIDIFDQVMRFSTKEHALISLLTIRKLFMEEYSINLNNDISPRGVENSASVIKHMRQLSTIVYNVESSKYWDRNKQIDNILNESRIYQ